MPNYKLITEYDGSKFWGWQVQPNLRTVQGELEKAFFLFSKEKIRIVCAGRTDRGVHALAQVANFKCVRPIDPVIAKRALNGITRNDVLVHDVQQVPDGFNARFDAVARQYIYKLSLRPRAIGRQYTYYCKFPLDVEAMQQASKCLLGEHSFEAFSRKSADEKHYLSHVEFVEWRQDGDRLVFRIRANRFVYGMVRMLVGSLVQVGRGVIPVVQFAEILASKSRDQPGFKAPAHGLFFEKAIYPKDVFG